jgi:hypothetical protein
MGIKNISKELKIGVGTVYKIIWIQEYSYEWQRRKTYKNKEKFEI